MYFYESDCAEVSSQQRIQNGQGLSSEQRPEPSRSHDSGRHQKNKIMKRLVLLRHGESIWNKENRFTGWTDIDLSEKGIEEARQAAKILRQDGSRHCPCRHAESIADHGSTDFGKEVHG